MFLTVQSPVGTQSSHSQAFCPVKTVWFYLRRRTAVLILRPAIVGVTAGDGEENFVDLKKAKNADQVKKKVLCTLH